MLRALAERERGRAIIKILQLSLRRHVPVLTLHSSSLFALAHAGVGGGAVVSLSGGGVVPLEVDRCVHSTLRYRPFYRYDESSRSTGKHLACERWCKSVPAANGQQHR